MRSIFTIGLAAMLLLAALAARADDVALIYGDSGQSPFFQSGDNVAPSTFSEPLSEAGFTVIEPARRDAAAMRRAAQQVQKMLDDDQVDRLLIVVYGPFASNVRDNWALSNDAASASGITVGATGISVNALSDMAERSGRGVVMLAPGRTPTSLGSGLVPGLGDITSVGNVTYFTGTTEALAAVVTGGLLETGRSYAALASALPSRVRMMGYVPADSGFMGEAGAEGDDQMREAGYWQAIRDVDTIEAYRLYLRAYPGAANRAVAQERITFLQGAPERLARAAEDALQLSAAARKDIQRDLKVLDLYASGIDGRFGKGSRTAVAAWQRSHGFDETGYISGDQLVALRNDAKERGDQIARQRAKAKLNREREDLTYWNQTGKDGDEAGLRAYLKRFPEGAFAGDARGSLAAMEDARQEDDNREADDVERRAWQAAKAGDTPEDYIDYLNVYPKGRYAERAKKQLDSFQNAPEGPSSVARAQAEENEITGSGVSRYLIEQRLEQAGAQPGPVDGRFDAQTREAIRWYQDSRALPVTGYLSRVTLLHLMAGD